LLAFADCGECLIKVFENFLGVAVTINGRYGVDVFDIWFFWKLHHDFMSLGPEGESGEGVSSSRVDQVDEVCFIL
jgi:hypothetical protein